MRMLPMAVAVLMTAFWTSPIMAQSYATSSTAPSDSVTEWIEQNLVDLQKLYMQLHKSPELSFQEKETAQRIGRELEAVGVDVTYNIGGFGIVGILENGQGPTVMVRTDLDALPVAEQTNLPYASTKKAKTDSGQEVGLMHACGHDMHMTVLVGVARYLASHRDQWQGRVMFIGQPAEERGAGARAMLDDGLFERFGKPDYALALHCSATLPSGTVGLRAGYAMANVDSVDIELIGRGGHGAYPHTTIDPNVMAAKLILDLQTIVSREINPTDAAVVTVGSIHGGTKHNIIPDRCHLQLTVRSYSDEVRQHILDAIRRKANAVAASAGADKPEVVVSEGTPSLSNDEPLTRHLADVLRKKLGDQAVIDVDPVMGGEDFSHFGRAGVPSLLYWLGVVDQKRLDRYKSLGTEPPSLHSPLFFPDMDDSIRTGVASMTNSVLELLNNDPLGARKQAP